MKTPLTLERLKHHFGYRWWQYLLIIVVCFAVCNYIFSVTAAKPAEDEQVDVLVYGPGNSEAMSAWLELLRRDEFPEQEVFSCSFILPDVNGAQALFVRVGAGNEGDLLILPKEQFQSYAESGALKPLEGTGALAACTEYGIAVDRGRWKGPDDETHLYGVPVSALRVLNEGILLGGGRDSFLCIHHNNGNEKTTEQVLLCMLRDLREIPETSETTQAPETGEAKEP